MSRRSWKALPRTCAHIRTNLCNYFCALYERSLVQTVGVKDIDVIWIACMLEKQHSQSRVVVEVGGGGKGERGDILNSRGINVKPKNMYK